MRTLTTTAARIIFGIPWLVFGTFHFLNADQMTGAVPFPPETFWVYLTGAAMIAAGIAFIINKYGKIAGLLLALMLLIFILMVHIPGILSAENQQQMMSPMQSMLKDTALMAGALAIAGLFDRGSV